MVMVDEGCAAGFVDRDISASGVDSTRGYDTKGVDNEQPLTPQDQVVAILDIKARDPPPLPVDPKHARATAKAVREHTLAIRPEQRKQAHNFALATPLKATSIAEWVEQHRSLQRKEHTLKTALLMALYPKRTGVDVCKQVGCSIGHMYIVRGLALHLRMHPFTRSEVQCACGEPFHYTARYTARVNNKRSASPTAFGCNVNKRMQAADTLLLFQSGARCFKI